jgi:hypothetical protein
MNNTNFFSFILIIGLLTTTQIQAAEPTTSDEIFIGSMVPDAPYKSVHSKLNLVQKLLLPIDALSFISEPSYFLTVSKYPLLPDPNFVDWAKAAIASPTNQEAYRLFLAGKHDLEKYQDILTVPPIQQPKKDNKNGDKIDTLESSQTVTSIDYDIPNFSQSLGFFISLNQSLTQSDNAWTRLYRGISLARLRAFQPALDDLQMAREKFNRIGADEKRLLTERAIHQVILWQQGHGEIVESECQVMEDHHFCQTTKSCGGEKKHDEIVMFFKPALTQNAQTTQIAQWLHCAEYLIRVNQNADLHQDILLTLLPLVQQHNLQYKMVGYWKQVSTLYLTAKAFEQDTYLLQKILPLLTDTIGISPFQLALRDVFIDGLPQEILEQRFTFYQLNPVEQQTLHQLYHARRQYQKQVDQLATVFFTQLQTKIAQEDHLSPQQQHYLWSLLMGEIFNRDPWSIAITFWNQSVGVEDIAYLLRTGIPVGTALFPDIQKLWTAQQGLYRALTASLNHPNAPVYLRKTHQQAVKGIAYLEKMVPNETVKVVLAPFIVDKIYLKQLVGQNFDVIEWMQAYESLIKATVEQPDREKILTLIAQFIGYHFSTLLIGDDLSSEASLQKLQAQIEKLKPLLLCTAQWIDVDNASSTDTACQFKWFQFGSEWLLRLVEQWTKNIAFFHHNPELFQIIRQVNQTTLSTLAENLPTKTSLFSWLGEVWLTQFYQQFEKRRHETQEILQWKTQLFLDAIAYWLAHETYHYAEAISVRQHLEKTFKKSHLADLAESTQIALHLVHLLLSETKTSQFNSLQQLSLLLSPNNQKPVAELLHTALSILIHLKPEWLSSQFNPSNKPLDEKQIAKYRALFPLPTPHQLERIKSPLAQTLTLMLPSFYTSMSPTEITTFISKMIEKRFQGQQRSILEIMLKFALAVNTKELNYAQLKVLSRFSLQTPINLAYNLPLSIDYAHFIPYIMPYTSQPNHQSENVENNLEIGVGITQKLGPFITITLNQGGDLTMAQNLALLKAALNEDDNKLAEQHFYALLPPEYLDKRVNEPAVFSHQNAIIVYKGARAVLEALQRGHKLSTQLENLAVTLLTESFIKGD